METDQDIATYLIKKIRYFSLPVSQQEELRSSY